MNSVGFLTREEIKKAIKKGTLIITPLIEPSQISDASIDVRLGSRLIVIKPSDIPSIDPRNLSYELIRRIQQIVYLSIGDRFVLHPNQFILGSTLEFIGLDENHCAFVLSRSRFGRAGLLVATATFIHPKWKGVLTLELSNASERPLFLECGAPIAQIVISSAQPEVQLIKKKLIPTLPQFAETKDMPDWGKLEKFRNIWEDQGYILTEKKQP